jgi:hypothetical protein
VAPGTEAPLGSITVPLIAVYAFIEPAQTAIMNGILAAIVLPLPAASATELVR